jgi:hypothetical protein
MKSIRFVPVVALALGVLSTSACATGYAYGGQRDRGYGGYGGYDRGYAGAERIAYDNGFREGIRAGEKDARKHHRFEPRRDGDWRDGDNGYRREYGDRGFYRRNFRNGFEAGYAQGFRRFDDGRYRRW